MGTSKAYGGPRGIDLIPAWAQESPEQPDEQSEVSSSDPAGAADSPEGQSGDTSSSDSVPGGSPPPISAPSAPLWTSAKRRMSGVARAGGGRDKLRRVGRSYVAAKGG